MQPKHAHQLLEVIAYHGVVHMHIDIIERLSNDRMAPMNFQHYTRRCEEGRWVHAQTTKVTNHETPYFVRRLEREARDGVLWMGLEGDAVLKHRRNERGKENAHEDAR